MKLTVAWRIMRLTTLFILITALHLSAKTTAQKITLSASGITIGQFFDQLSKQTGFSFLLGDGTVSAEQKISVHVTEMSLEDVLDQILKPLSLSYSIDHKMVMIHKTESPVSVLKAEDVPPIDIHGRVTDSLGNPLSGASILIKGTKRGTTTDVNGNFTLSGVKENAVLNISYTGYIHREYKWTGDASFTITLIKSNNPLDAVVVIPYGTTTQRLNTGNISTVTSKTIEQQPVSNVLEALEGRVPGLLITQTTGLPGGSYNVNIRGLNSIANGTNPFYVIDGVPYNSQLAVAPVNGTLGAGNPLNYMNPYDIESVEVLKDADATAIYGSRAANGAILITTKKGKVGAMKVNVNLQSGITEPARTIAVLNTQQYLMMRNEAFKNDGMTPGPGDHDVNGNWDTTRYTNWPQLMANKPAQYTTANADISGGTTNTQYLVGAGYTYQNTGEPTLLPNDGGNKTGSVHFNISTSSPNQKFKLTIMGSYVSNKNTVQSEDFTSSALTLAPDAPPLFNPDGTLNWAPLAPGQTGTWFNPYSKIYSQTVSSTSNMVGNAILSYQLIKGLEIRTSLGYTNTQTDEFQLQPITTYDPGQDVTSGSSAFQTSNSHSWIIEPQINYNKQIGKSALSGLIGATFQGAYSNYTNTSATGFSSDALLQDVQAASSVYVRSNGSEYKYQAVYGRLGYNWADKYLINLTARRDGTSRFGPGKQFGNFGAVGAGWVFTNEDFIKRNLPFISFGKLRASYGTTGSDQVQDYQFIDTYSPTYVPYGNSPGLQPNNLFNSVLAWETTKKLEGGIELGFLNDRITVSASFYRNRSGNELVQTPVSSVTGFKTISENLPALVQNTGQEFELNTLNIKTKNFKWSSSFNLTTADNRLLAFPNLASSPYANILVIGQPINVQQAFKYAGVNPTTGIYQFASANGNPTSTPLYGTDPIDLINTTPKFYGGFQNTFSYKSFSLDIFFQFRKQIGLKLWAQEGANPPGTMFNVPTDVLNRWQKPGDIAEYERFTQDYGSAATNALNYAYVSNFAYGNASFIRLKNVSLSWQIPQSVAKKIGAANFRVYVQGQNLMTLTKYDGMDPESQNALTGPRRVYTAGIQAGF
jgi:TonB-dependent starch-binding outer membrane protein SusC